MNGADYRDNSYDWQAPPSGPLSPVGLVFDRLAVAADGFDPAGEMARFGPEFVPWRYFRTVPRSISKCRAIRRADQCNARNCRIESTIAILSTCAIDGLRQQEAC